MKKTIIAAGITLLCLMLVIPVLAVRFAPPDSGMAIMLLLFLCLCLQLTEYFPLEVHSFHMLLAIPLQWQYLKKWHHFHLLKLQHFLF